MSDFDVAVVGSLNLDRSYSVERLPSEGETVASTSHKTFAGGKGANQAVAAARAGARVALIGAVGGDSAGEELRASVSAAGVDVTGVVARPGDATGEAVLLVDAHGRNQIVVAAGANGGLSFDDVASRMPDTTVVVSGFEVPDAAVVAAARHAHRIGAHFILNPSPYRAMSSEVLALTSVLVLNGPELACVAESSEGNAKRHLAEIRVKTGVECLIVTLGAEGAVVATPAQVVRLNAPRVDAVDTAGCGDGFTGAFAAALALGSDWISAVKIANRFGAFAATRRGTQDSYPSANELESWHPAQVLA